MNCQEFWSSENQGQSEHLKECPDCAAAWAREREITAGLRRLAVEWRSVEAPARVETRLVHAFQKQAGFSALRFRPRWAPVVTGFSAAAALVLAALLFVRGPEQPKPARRTSPAAVQLAADDMPGGVGESAGEFIPLPNAEQLESGEEVNLVRVEVPRSAMIALGYNVSADRALEPVSADVMLGADGLAHAIRFLDE